MDPLEDLTDRIVAGLPATRRSWRGRWLARLVRPLARRLVRPLVALDRDIAAVGLQAATRRLLESYGQRLEVHAPVAVPTGGPLLVVANHPGLADFAALVAAMAHPRLLVHSGDWGFLQALPNVRARALLAADGMAGRAAATRAAIEHLRGGGALLIFGARLYEPDPAVLPGAVAALARWADGSGYLVQQCPEVTVVPAVVSGVLGRKALASPLCRLARSPESRLRVAEALHALWPPYHRGQTLRVAFAPPLAGRDLLDRHGDAKGVALAVREQVRLLLEAVPVAG